MPTENERKYVLCLDFSLENEVNQVKIKEIEIEQSFLRKSPGISHRLRKSLRKGNICYELTYKHNVNKRTVEITTQVSKRDFDDLWTASYGQVRKIRYLVKEDDDLWEIDFFKDHYGKNYFVLAEIELPEGVPEPKKLARIVKSNLVFEVPIGDGRFSNKKLGNVHHATDLYKSLVE